MTTDTTASNDSSTSETTFTGTGEFEIKKIYVKAEVEVRDGIVHRIDFTAGNDGDVPEAAQVAEQLRGQPLLRALEVKATEVDVAEARVEPLIKVALLEAFHRAVEVCLDNE
jgi:hypothetical protein